MDTFEKYNNPISTPSKELSSILAQAMMGKPVLNQKTPVVKWGTPPSKELSSILAQAMIGKPVLNQKTPVVKWGTPPSKELSSILAQAMMGKPVLNQKTPVVKWGTPPSKELSSILAQAMIGKPVLNQKTPVVKWGTPPSKELSSILAQAMIGKPVLNQKTPVVKWGTPPSKELSSILAQAMIGKPVLNQKTPVVKWGTPPSKELSSILAQAMIGKPVLNQKIPVVKWGREYLYSPNNTLQDAQKNQELIKLNILENGIDFLEESIKNFLIGGNDLKYAIINIVQAIELIFKHTISSSLKSPHDLIYEDVDNLNNNITLKTALKRLSSKAGIEIKENDRKKIFEAKKQRNQFTHKDVTINIHQEKKRFYHLFSFLVRFYKNHLNEDIFIKLNENMRNAILNDRGFIEIIFSDGLELRPNKKVTVRKTVTFPPISSKIEGAFPLDCNFGFQNTVDLLEKRYPQIVKVKTSTTVTPKLAN